MSRYIITSKDDLARAVALLTEGDAFTFDIEAQGPNRGVPHICDVTWISLASDHVVCAIPMGHAIGTKQTGTGINPKLCADGKIRNYKYPIWEPPPPQLERGYVFDQLRPLFCSDRQVKVAADHTVDSVAVTQYLGEVPWPPYDCVITMDWLLDENRLQHGVKPQVRDYFGYVYDKEKSGARIEEIPFAKAGHYSAMDALYEWLLYKRHRKLLLADPDLAGAWQMERDLIGTLIGMRLTGAPVDEDIARQHEKDLAARLVQHEAAVYRAAGRTFSLNSVPQKQAILYSPRSDGGQGLKPWKLTPGGDKKQRAGTPLGISDYSTDDDVMQSYPGNVVVDALRGYGDVNKLLNTYVRAWLGTDDKPGRIHDGRIHTWFKAYGTVTGRLSSSEPNLQNVPRPGTADGKLLRSIFSAPGGWKEVVADYGQIELVVIAHFIGHGGLYDAFMEGLDPHRMTAASMFGCAPEDVTPVQRQICKTTNFLISYGGRWNRLMISANKSLPPEDKISARTAKDVIARYDRTYPEIEEYKAAVMSVARSRNPSFLRTLIGRKRHLPRLNSSQFKIRAAAEREAFSAVIQGSAADLLKLGMIRADQMLAAQLPDAYLTMNIHDEIVALALEDQAEKARDVIVEAMTGPQMQALVRVPLKVDAKVVDNWASAK